MSVMCSTGSLVLWFCGRSSDLIVFFQFYLFFYLCFFFNDTATTEIYTLSLHDALPIYFHLDNGTNAIVSMGTTGESATLNMDEHCGVIKHTVDYVAGRIPVIAGTGANSTSEAIELTTFAAQSGANACLLVTPYYNKPTQEGLYLH